MQEKKFIKIIDNNGKETKYEILLAFGWEKTGKNYIVYTDNTYNEEKKLNIYASIYYSKNQGKLDLIETEEEWNEIEKRIKFIQNI